MSRSRQDDALRDSDVSRVLRAALPEPPIDSVDWDELHGRIVRAAGPRLERSHTLRWWEPLARWTVTGIPAAATAVIVLALGVAVPWSVRQPADVADFTVEDELVAGIPEAQLPLLYADHDLDALLHVVLYYDGEER